MKLSIIAAIGKNRELGKDNKLIWHIKEDLQRFKALTSGHPIIMGRKTWESLPIKPLPNRYNIVITSSANYQADGAVVCNSIEEGIKRAKRHSGEVEASTDSRIDSGQARMTKNEVFVIGGGQIYEQAIKKGLVDKLYLTLVDGSFDADTFFPDYSDFKKVVFEKESQSDKYKYRFLELER